MMVFFIMSLLRNVSNGSVFNVECRKFLINETFPPKSLKCRRRNDQDDLFHVHFIYMYYQRSVQFFYNYVIFGSNTKGRNSGHLAETSPRQDHHRLLFFTYCMYIIFQNLLKTCKKIVL